MFIYGWGHQMRKDFGPLFKRLCGHCHNEQYWNLLSVSVWFTIFFIPVFPYKFIRRIYCPVCNYGYELENEKFEELKPLAINNKKLIDGDIALQQYNELMNVSNSENKNIPMEPGKNLSELPTVENTREYEEVNFCKDCGNKINQDANFCSKCGVGR